MNKRQNNPARALVLQATLSLVLLFLGSIFFAFLFAAPQSGKLGSAASGSSFPQVSAAISPSGQSCVNSWIATNVTGAPSARGRHSAVWTGSQMIIWGGGVNTGARFDPITDAWTPTALDIGTPVDRSDHTAVWTGSEMIVWGGSRVLTLNTGARYNPLTNSWTGTSVTNGPTARTAHTAIWTGSEMIVWGGSSSASGNSGVNTGGRYNPVTNSWTPVSLTGAPSARNSHTAVWTGSEMIVWGGFGVTALNTGARYNPLTDTWTALSTVNAPAARFIHTAVWTGSEMIVWGGTNSSSMNSGGRYNPVTDTWTATSTTNAPVGRWDQTAIWTGNEMIVWGGIQPLTNTGGRYDPKTDSWSPTNTSGAPPARNSHSAVWTGNEMIVWGGFEDDGVATPTSAPGFQTGASPDSLDTQFPVATGGRYCAKPGPTPEPTLTPTPPPTSTPSPTAPPGLTVSLPIDTLDNQVPIDTVFLKPVMTTNIDPGLGYVAFQGDFTFDEEAITFSDPFVEPAGLTANNWNVSGNILPGPGPVRILRVSAFSNDFTPLSGSGILYNLRMRRVSDQPGRSTPLDWRPPPDHFIFIDGNLGKIAPNQTDGFITITGKGPTATPTPTATPLVTPTPGSSCVPVITQSTSQVITPGSVSCNGGAPNFFHADNSYWRALNMAAVTAGQAYNVTSVSFGIENAVANPSAGTQPVTVRLHRQVTGVFPGGTRTQIATTTVNVTDQMATVLNVPLVATVAQGTSELVMEVFTPNGQAPVNNSFFIGSNAAPQTGPSYISAATCGLTDPTDVSTIGFPNMHIVFNVNGNCPDPTPPGPTPTPTVAPSPTPPFEGVILLWEGFDTTIPPAVPKFWHTSFVPGAANCIPTGTCGFGTNWGTTKSNPYSGPVCAFHDAPACVTDSVLDTRSFGVPQVGITGEWGSIRFRHKFNLENGRDGAVLEFSVDGGPFTDIVAAGGSANYNGTISTGFLSPIGGRPAWTGDSGGYIQGLAGLPSSTQGHTVALRFRLATDCSGSGTGWSLDEVLVTARFAGTPPPPPSPTPTPPPNGKIVFSRPALPIVPPTPTPSEDGSQIFSMDSNGTSVTQLTFTDTQHPSRTSPKWSFDGTKIVYVERERLMSPPFFSYSIKVLGGSHPGMVAPANLESNPAWSPDGTRIVFSLGSIWVVNEDGSNLTNLNQPGGSPAWSPDGAKIVFGSSGGIRIMNPDGSDLVNLTGNPADSEPAWSSDGTKIVFNRAGGIWVMNADGSNPIDLNRGGQRPSWSPDGSQIAFQRDAQIYTMNANGSNEFRISNVTFANVEPNWRWNVVAPTPTPTATATGTPSPTPTPGGVAHAINLSTRLRVGTENNAGIGGFIITGSEPKQILLRGIGPSLSNFGIADPLADPVLELHGPGPFATITNNNWKDIQQAEIAATGIPPTNDYESAILFTLDPGAYTAVLRGRLNGTGVGLVELYDLTQGTSSKLGNISTRAFVGTGSDIVIAGFIVAGGTNDDAVLVRGIGPSLTAFGVPNALANPALELRSSNGTLIASNDDWQNGPPVSLPPTEPLESAIETTVPPGAYTALLSGVSGGTGVGLVEVYDFSPPGPTPAPTPTPTPTVAPSPTPPFEGIILLWEGFDTTIPPAVPKFWHTSFVAGAANCIPTGTCGLGTNWATTKSNPYSGPVCVFHDAPACVTDSVLDTRSFAVPQVGITGEWGLITFQHKFNLENGRDGGVLEFSVDGGPFTDIVAGGGSANYNGTIATGFLSPIGGRPAWTGDSGGYIQGVAGLPSSTQGHTVSLRFRLATDCSGSGTGWSLDGVLVTARFGGTPPPPPTPPCLEAFDEVTAPALPVGWVATNPDPGDGILWTTSTTLPDTAPNAAFINDQDGISDKVLDSKPITITSATAQVTFRNYFNTEFSNGVFWDGGVLEISSPNISNGDFLDVTDPAVGGSFVSGGYTGEINGKAANPLAGRMAWSGDSGGYINSVANLGSRVNGQTIKLRFRMCTDEAVPAPGWWIDGLSVTGGECP